MANSKSYVCRGLVLIGVLAGLSTPPANANPSMSAIAAVTAAITAWAATHPQQVPRGGSAYALSGGVFDDIDRVARTWSFGIERRWGGFAVWRLKPFLGSAVTGRESAYLYGGLRLDLHLAPRLIVAPNFALAGYFHGDGKRLGSPIEFRSGVEIDWRMATGLRVGVAYHHLSHWIFFGSKNPGTEVLAITLAIPLH